ncbi:hypothetical protein ACH4PU_26910 [Streptomyces sp. NPDC021100]|uniref:hypothetical protein n=1 Tax=Streptomyces sp. NPDC021100 TaxID=3365114 RepID=UPI00378DC4FA
MDPGGEGQGTRLFLVHEGFDPDNAFRMHAPSIMDSGRRSGMLRGLRAALDRK